jgi:hypothetical protein
VGFVATDITTVPSNDNYRWYIFILEHGWADKIGDEVANNFMKFAEKVGPNALVVRGTDPLSFYSQVFENYILLSNTKSEKIVLPAILVADISPEKILETEENIERAKILVFSLSRVAQSQGGVVEFLIKLADTIREEGALDNFENSNDEKLEGAWGWVRRYVEIKPNFFGFGVNVNALVDRWWRSRD